MLSVVILSVIVHSIVMVIFNMLLVVMLSIMTPFVSKIKAAVPKIAFALLKVMGGGEWGF
jgi:hypothetical protein